MPKINRKLNRDRGKAFERHIAKKIGGKRIGIIGGEDVAHEVISVEAKAVSRSTAHTWYDQCERNAPLGKLPVVVVHKHSSKHDTDLAILNLDMFLELLNKGSK